MIPSQQILGLFMWLSTSIALWVLPYPNVGVTKWIGVRRSDLPPGGVCSLGG